MSERQDVWTLNLRDFGGDRGKKKEELTGRDGRSRQRQGLLVEWALKIWRCLIWPYSANWCG